MIEIPTKAPCCKECFHSENEWVNCTGAFCKDYQEYKNDTSKQSITGEENE